MANISGAFSNQRPAQRERRQIDVARVGARGTDARLREQPRLAMFFGTPTIVSPGQPGRRAPAGTLSEEVFRTQIRRTAQHGDLDTPAALLAAVSVRADEFERHAAAAGESLGNKRWLHEQVTLTVGWWRRARSRGAAPGKGRAGARPAAAAAAELVRPSVLAPGLKLKMRYDTHTAGSTQGTGWRKLKLRRSPHASPRYSKGLIVIVEDLTDPEQPGKRKVMYEQRVLDHAYLD